MKKTCPGCGKRRQLIPITVEEARQFGTRRPPVGTEFCAACIENPPPGPPRDLVAELNHVALLCQHAAQDLSKNPTASKIAISVAIDLLRDIKATQETP